MERDHNLHENVSHWPLNLCSFLKRITLSLPSGIYLDPSCPEEGHAAAPLPSWPARGQQEQLYKSWLYKKKWKISGRSSSWELTPPRQPQTVNYRGGLTWFLRFPGDIKQSDGAPLNSLHFRSDSALLFRRVGSIPRRLQGGCSGLCELSYLFWLLRCFKMTYLLR